jgi:hypothetical protein
VPHPPIKPDPAYLKAFATIMARLGRALESTTREAPVKACVAGGAALHFYTGARISKDIDARVMARVLVDPADLQVAYKGPDGHARLLYFDTQYNDSFALLHADAYDDARSIALEGVDPAVLDVRLLTPLDLAVSKLARFSDQDQEDIRALARARLIEANSLRRRANDALPDYVGNLLRIRTSIDIATRVVMKETAGKSTKKGARGAGEPS